MHANAIQARQPTAVAARALWLVRWLLVLVLVFDQISSSLHPHLHHAEVDAQWITASTSAAPPDVSHLEDHGHDPRAAHPVLAVRQQVELHPVTTSGDDTGHRLLPSQVFALPELDPAEAEVHGMAALARPHSTHRSLPPAGRAPPLHT